MCVGMPTYSTEKERMALLGADQLLLQWLTELVSVTAWAAGTGGSPGRFGYLGTLAILGGGSPRQLLSAVPQTMTIIANVMWEMTAGTSAVNDQVGHLLIALTDVLKDLAFVDSRGFRRLEGLAGTLAAVEAISCAHLELNMNSSGFLENIVELVKVLTPVAASINESPGGLALLCKLATRTGNPAQLRWASSAACIGLFVGVKHLVGGAEQLPSTLRAAAPDWRLIGATHPNALAAEASRHLGLSPNLAKMCCQR